MAVWPRVVVPRRQAPPSAGTVTSKYIHTLDTALIMAAGTISGCIPGLPNGFEFKQTAYALDRDSRRLIGTESHKTSFDRFCYAVRRGVSNQWRRGAFDLRSA